MKFKIDDRVKCVGRQEDCVVGDTGKIINIDDGSLPYLVEFDNEREQYHDGGFGGVKGKPSCCYWCCEETLELDNHKPIIIYQNGNEVVAFDKESGKKAVAKCAPNDEFDFMTGAKLAFERLVVELQLEKLKFKIGDRVTSDKGRGTVICITDSTFHYGVRLDNSKGRYHSCTAHKLLAGTSGTNDDCWWFTEEELELYNEKAFYVGDLVRIIDTGKIFPSIISWVKQHVHNEDFKLRWAYNNEDWYNNGIKKVDAKVFKVLAVAEDKAYIVDASNESWGKCYVIGFSGLKKC